MLMQPNSMPIVDQQSQVPQQEQDNTEFGDNGDDGDIIQGLESHLNDISTEQKTFLAEVLQKAPEIVIPTLGIVCGQEVYDYFMQLYATHFAQGQNSPEGQPQPQGQSLMAPQAAPQQNMGSKLAPIPQPSQQKVFQPQAKATQGPMG